MKIAVCDDNKIMVDYLCRKVSDSLAKNEAEFEIYKYRNGNILLNANSKEQFDVVFLDIQMPKIDGFEVASKLKKVSSETLIIFITSNDDLVFKSFDYQPFHFIRKGINGEMERDIEKTIRLFLGKIKPNNVITLELPHLKKMSIATREILYIESDKHYLDYHLNKEDKVRVRGTIDLIAPQMLCLEFVRIHRRVLVNIEYIKRANPLSNSLILTNGEILTIGGTYENETNEKLLEHLRSKSY